MSESDIHIRSAAPQGPQSSTEQISDSRADFRLRGSDAPREGSAHAGNKLKDVSDAATHRLQDGAKEQQRSGADFIGKLAENLRQAAHAFENDAPFAARGINSGADYVQDAAEKIRNGTFADLVDGASDFAKRQPAAFLGLSVLAGFAAVRFFRASGAHTKSSQQENAR